MRRSSTRFAPTSIHIGGLNVVTVAAIPRNAAGKVLKYQLRREYGGEGA